jgi:hypothetical protein
LPPLITGKTTACFRQNENVSSVARRLKIQVETGRDMGISRIYKRWNSTNLHTPGFLRTLYSLAKFPAEIRALCGKSEVAEWGGINAGKIMLK